MTVLGSMVGVEASRGSSVARRCAVSGLALALAWGAAVVPGRAADETGIHAFWQSQAGERQRARPAPSPSPLSPAPTPQALPIPRYQPATASVPAPRIERAARSLKAVPAAKTSYAALPTDPDAPTPKVQVPEAVRKAPTPIAAVLRDPTLRPGDVVMFPDGPRVYKGDGGTRHRLADFEDATRSKVLSNTARKTLVALTKQPASTSAEARRYVRSLGSKGEAPAEERQALNEAMRVIYPGLPTP